jgi:uncharacterized protein YjcR
MVEIENPDVEQFKKDFYSGMNYQNLANKYLVSLSTIHNWIKKNKIARVWVVKKAEWRD